MLVQGWLSRCEGGEQPREGTQGRCLVGISTAVPCPQGGNVCKSMTWISQEYGTAQFWFGNGCGECVEVTGFVILR